MKKKIRENQKRGNALSRDRVIETSIELLNGGGETELTFRALSQRLDTGPGAIYWHIDNKSDLLNAACDLVIARTLNAVPKAMAPDMAIRAVALAMFDMMDEYPWIGSALAQAGGKLPMVRILDVLGQQIQVLDVPEQTEWAAASALLNFILGVGGQNAANAQTAQRENLERDTFLGEISNEWSKLDPVEFPFAYRMAPRLPAHDDRADFLAGIDFIIQGLAKLKSNPDDF
jgi:AcrR family transcriptional regulator